MKNLLSCSKLKKHTSQNRYSIYMYIYIKLCFFPLNPVIFDLCTSQTVIAMLSVKKYISHMLSKHHVLQLFNQKVDFIVISKIS